MRVLVTGSSGQIGTNLALRLLDDGHEVFGVDKRLNAWTDRFPYLFQHLGGRYPASRAGIAASSTLPRTSSSTPPRTPRCTSWCSGRSARSRRRPMTFNVRRAAQREEAEQAFDDAVADHDDELSVRSGVRTARV